MTHSVSPNLLVFAPHLQQQRLEACEACAYAQVNLLPRIHCCCVCCVGLHQLLQCALQLPGDERTEAGPQDAQVAVDSSTHLDHLLGQYMAASQQAALISYGIRGSYANGATFVAPCLFGSDTMQSLCFVMVLSCC